MSTPENAVGIESGASGSENKKGRFTVKFGIGRLDSDGSEINIHPPIQEHLHPSGKLVSLIVIC